MGVLFCVRCVYCGVCGEDGGRLLLVGHLCLAGFSVGQPMLWRRMSCCWIYLQRLTMGGLLTGRESEQTAFTWCT
jgi:hypothetical protein